MSLVDIYAPKKWDELIGQNHIVKFLKTLINDPDKYPKNIIFNGPFGTGKTSTVRIFSSELNKIKNTKYYEFDLAVIGNKDALKEIKKRIDNLYKYSKDYIILVFDEIQQANKAAQSVFMKTLEDNILDDNSIRNIFFFFLTTDSSKIIDTISSRCIDLNFLYISYDDIKKRLLDIIEKEKINISNDHLDKIIDLSEGHLRDAIKLIDKYIISGKNFKELFFDLRNLLYNYIFTDTVDINNIVIFPVNVLLRDLGKVVLKYVDLNVDKDYINVLNFLSLYMKYKNYIDKIEEFVTVIKLLKKFINNKKKV